MLSDEILSKLIRASILSARVKNEDIFPVSLFLIAPVENGKTSLAIQNAGEKPLVLSDVSGIGLLEALWQEKQVTHVIINDLAAVGGHRASVSKLTISILNGLAEEGCYKIALPRMGHLDLAGRRIGVIACCTPDLVSDNRTWWQRSGFASRVLPVRFQHSISLQIKILQSIAKGPNGKGKSAATFKVPEAMINVKIPAAQAQKILSISQQIAKHYNEAGYRRQKQLRALACGAALIRTWRNPSVTNMETDFLADSLPFLLGGKEI